MPPASFPAMAVTMPGPMAARTSRSFPLKVSFSCSSFSTVSMAVAVSVFFFSTDITLRTR